MKVVSIFLFQFSEKVTPHWGKDSSICPKIDFLNVSLFTKFPISKSPFSQNSHFQSLIFHKIHILKVSFFTKFTFFKLQILGHFWIKWWFLPQCVCACFCQAVGNIRFYRVRTLLYFTQFSLFRDLFSSVDPKKRFGKKSWIIGKKLHHLDIYIENSLLLRFVALVATISSLCVRV